jgi:hypothetical protein
LQWKGESVRVRSAQSEPCGPRQWLWVELERCVRKSEVVRVDIFDRTELVKELEIGDWVPFLLVFAGEGRLASMSGALKIWQCDYGGTVTVI